jgi:hypothetical protein
MHGRHNRRPVRRREVLEWRSWVITSGLGRRQLFIIRPYLRCDINGLAEDLFDFAIDFSDEDGVVVLGPGMFVFDVFGGHVGVEAPEFAGEVEQAANVRRGHFVAGVSEEAVDGEFKFVEKFFVNAAFAQENVAFALGQGNEVGDLDGAGLLIEWNLECS